MILEAETSRDAQVTTISGNRRGLAVSGSPFTFWMTGALLTPQTEPIIRPLQLAESAGTALAVGLLLSVCGCRNIRVGK